MLPDGSQPRVLQVIEVPLLGYASDPTQPENWHLAAGKPWGLVSGAGPVPWELLHDKPPDLWIDWNQATDRITATALAGIHASPSLYLIRPRKFRLVVNTERDGHRRRRAVFEYGRHRYNLSVTDPTIDERYLNPYPTHDQGLRKVVLPAGDNCFLCISRTPEFEDGYHYKIVATIIEPGA